MRKLAIVLVPLLILVLVMGGIGCGGGGGEVPMPTFTVIPTFTPTPTHTPTRTLTPAGDVIEDLAYIRGSAMPYTDDADPEYEGVEITVLFYNGRSEPIWFKNIPMLVDIELYTTKLDTQTLGRELVRCVYQGTATISKDHEGIRIPFQSIVAKPDEDGNIGGGKLVVHTPQQGDFADDEVGGWVILYEPQ